MINALFYAFSTLCGPMGCGTCFCAASSIAPSTFSTLCGPMGCGTASHWPPPQSCRAFSTLCGPMGCGTRLSGAQPRRLPPFQYPLRAYGVWNSYRQADSDAIVALSVPSAGLWGVERGHPPSAAFATTLSVPSAGLWGVERCRRCMSYKNRYTFSTLCGPMGCGTSPSTSGSAGCTAFSTLCGPMGCGTSARPRSPPPRCNFQYPLRAYGVWNAAPVPSDHGYQMDFQYPLRAYGVWNHRRTHRRVADAVLSVPSAGLWGVELWQ